MQTPLLAFDEHLPPISENAYGRINNKNKIDLILTLTSSQSHPNRLSLF